jgi:hypothetical protein
MNIHLKVIDSPLFQVSPVKFLPGCGMLEFRGISPGLPLSAWLGYDIEHRQQLKCIYIYDIIYNIIYVYIYMIPTI